MGPSDAIGSIYCKWKRAHTNISAAPDGIFNGPRRSRRQQLLKMDMGPYELIGRTCWKFNGPKQSRRQQLLKIETGPYELIGGTC